MILRSLLVLLVAASAANAQTTPQTREKIPATGVDEPARRGTYVETTLGIFTTFGGTANISNGQPYLGVAVGREVGRNVTVFGALGIGASSASCFTTTHNDICDAADSFGATYIEHGGSYGFNIGLRTLLSLKVVAGVTDLSPGPVKSGATVPDHLFGFHGGAGLALDYDTHLDHFAVGVDALLRYTMAKVTPAGEAEQTLSLPTFALMPRIRYVF